MKTIKEPMYQTIDYIHDTKCRDIDCDRKNYYYVAGKQIRYNFSTLEQSNAFPLLTGTMTKLRPMMHKM